MASGNNLPSLLSFFLLPLFIFQTVYSDHVLRTYIVHLDPSAAPASYSASSSSSNNEIKTWYETFLPASMNGSGSREPRLVYSYKNVLTGFAARLSDGDLTALKSKPGFLLAHPDQILQLQTTHTPEFLGLHRDGPGLWTDSKFGKGVVIGLLDSGVSPDHPSFSDKGMPPPPAKWKGVCEFNKTLCNNKLIGARDLIQSSFGVAPVVGPYDINGHGTHTASTAAGAFVENANVAGQANGTAAGMAPLAHLAIYKVCYLISCAMSSILAGMEMAIDDGVDVLSLSIGGSSLPFYLDTIAISSLRAIEKGIFVSCAAGNQGPFSGSLTNEAPWILTVGASTIDRSIRTVVKLGNGEEVNGESAYQPMNFSSASPLPLVYPGILGATDKYCSSSSLFSIHVAGMVVVCDDGYINWIQKGENVKRAGGAAMIIANSNYQGDTTYAHPHVLPASHVNYIDGLKIKLYIRSEQTPTAAIIFKGTIIGTSPAPTVASFSSRGPSRADDNILKPDIIGPGVNILAAWSSTASSNMHDEFSILRGTSMSTPHLSGIAALLKSTHPDWSPAAIKSAIMTTAYTTANDGDPIRDETSKFADYFATGAGHVDPSKANNPGLIYDVNPKDYVPYLCGLGYTDQQVSVVAGQSVRCWETGQVLGSHLNYPSFMIQLNLNNNYTMVVNRTVTNVGARASKYTVSVSAPAGATVTVNPQLLKFTKVNQKARYSVTFTALRKPRYSQGYLRWISSKKNITVNSVIKVYVG